MKQLIIKKTLLSLIKFLFIAFLFPAHVFSQGQGCCEDVGTITIELEPTDTTICVGGSVTEPTTIVTGPTDGSKDPNCPPVPSPSEPLSGNEPVSYTLDEDGPIPSIPPTFDSVGTYTYKYKATGKSVDCGDITDEAVFTVTVIEYPCCYGIKYDPTIECCCNSSLKVVKISEITSERRRVILALQQFMQGHAGWTYGDQCHEQSANGIAQVVQDVGVLKYHNMSIIRGTRLKGLAQHHVILFSPKCKNDCPGSDEVFDVFNRNWAGWDAVNNPNWDDKILDIYPYDDWIEEWTPDDK